jgi:hypothetical protein
VIASQVIAFVFRFDSDGNAHAAWETLDTTYERAEDRIEVAALGTATRAYSRAFSPYETWTEVLTQEGPYVYVVAVLSTSPDLDTVTLATDLIRTMLANQAGDGLGEFRTDGTSRGGLWDTLPSDDELPPGFVVDTDDQPYPLRAAEDAGMMDFGQVAGTQRAVWRAYSGIVGPSNPVRGWELYASVVEFDTPDHAAGALTPVGTAFRAQYAVPWVTLSRVAPARLGDQAAAAVGTSDETTGMTTGVAALVVQADRYLYAVVVTAIETEPGTLDDATGTETATLDMATAVVEAMIDAEAGGNEVAFDDAGGSTGGLWDKLPTAGDPVLHGMIPVFDELQYP